MVQDLLGPLVGLWLRLDQRRSASALVCGRCQLICRHQHILIFIHLISEPTIYSLVAEFLCYGKIAPSFLSFKRPQTSYTLYLYQSFQHLEQLATPSAWLRRLSQVLRVRSSLPHSTATTQAIYVAGNHTYPQQSSQENKPHGESNFVDGSGPLFSMYLELAEEEDKKRVESWKADADGILVFVSPISCLPCQ